MEQKNRLTQTDVIRQAEPPREMVTTVTTGMDDITRQEVTLTVYKRPVLH